ncbi:hypothetical protein AB4Y45_27900 [Paraburkholderia sp. EG287A]|uniref:hypothetical protein n=1 Tax=Paraburkholderia sp. EG287A TaxID=3237012 RepID=UPI0034D17300
MTNEPKTLTEEELARNIRDASSLIAHFERCGDDLRADTLRVLFDTLVAELKAVYPQLAQQGT